ncbi:MAG: glycosyltransferase family 2 protein [Lachnospiraceae bacterium]|nr:glycosyltransferase family 2 protein [Lachnospiraceae bacterium]MBQ6994457.1 glycosyltransferase family 2 protein [Lachnospiraceae bacterium]
MKLIIQIPCYNEADTLEMALNDLPTELEGIDEIEYLIINDGSRDMTEEVARQWGVHHIVNFSQNKGLARGFMAGLDGCLRNGADIIVNTDADNQYNAEDIQALIQPILDGEADMVIGARPIDETEHFSKLKKILQHFGSWAVRRASNTNIPDAPSGFRAMTREAAMHINVVNDYTYTLETIVQAGREKIAITSVPIRTNPELRPSRLFRGMWSYVKKSIVIILRAYMMYKPLKCFTYLSVPPVAVGLAIGMRFLYFLVTDGGGGHIQSLILACTLIIIGFLTFMIGLVSDLMASNRRILTDTQYHVRRMEYEAIEERLRLEQERVELTEGAIKRSV